MENRRSHANESGGNQEQSIAARNGQQDETKKCHSHAHGQRKRHRPVVCVEPDNRLEDRGSQLKGERNQAHLAEGQLKALLQQRVDRRYDRLDGVVKQMRETHRQQHREHRAGSLLHACLRVSLAGLHLPLIVWFSIRGPRRLAIFIACLATTVFTRRHP